jgi:hypothetical protein
MSGDVHEYSWDDDLKIEMPEPEGANMSLVNLKSTYRPFFIVSPDPVKTVEGTWDSPYFRSYAAKMAMPGYRPDPVPSAYGWWNHWPVAQIPGDGRWVITPDRPSHFNLTTFVQWEDYKYTDHTRTRIMLQGMTDKEADKLVPLAKSWLKPAKLEVKSGCSKGYDRSQRAYVLTATGSSISVLVKASEESPIVNPAFVAKGWGEADVALKIDGKTIKRGKNFRIGHERTDKGTNLIVWIKTESKKPIKISLTPINN